MADEKLVKVKMLKNAGPYKHGSVVEVPEDVAAELADGVKGQREEDFNKSEAAKLDPSKMTVAEAQKLGLKNIVNPDLAVVAQAEIPAVHGKPVASSEPITATGGVTPPTLVHPVMAEAGRHDVTDVKDVKGIRNKGGVMKSDDIGPAKDAKDAKDNGKDTAKK